MNWEQGQKGLHNAARISYQRVQEASCIPTKSKSNLRGQYIPLNPVALQRQIKTLQDDSGVRPWEDSQMMQRGTFKDSPHLESKVVFPGER